MYLKLNRPTIEIETREELYSICINLKHSISELELACFFSSSKNFIFQVQVRVQKFYFSSSSSSSAKTIEFQRVRVQVRVRSPGSNDGGNHL